MKKMMNRLNRREGFTLAELLIVVAIIAVLVAVAVPIFTKQLEQSRDSVSIANIRAAYAEAASAQLLSNGKATTMGRATTAASSGSSQTVTVTGIVLKGQASGWSNIDYTKELTFTPTGMTDAIGGTPGTYTALFTFNLADDSVVLTSLTAE